MVARGSSRGGSGGRQTNNPTGSRSRANNGPQGPTMSRQEGRATPNRPRTLPPLVETVVEDERPPPDPNPNQGSNEGWQQVNRRRGTTSQGQTSQRGSGERMPPRPPTPHFTATQGAQPAFPDLFDDPPQDRSGPEFRTRQDSPPDDDERSQGSIHFGVDNDSSQDSEEALEEQRRLSNEINNTWSMMLEHATGDLFDVNRPDDDNDPNSQVLTNTSVQQSILNQQGYFPMVRPSSAQRSRFGAMNPNSPYLLRVPQGEGLTPATTAGDTSMPDPTAGSGQDRRNEVVHVPPIVREQVTIPNPIPTLDAPALGIN
jgi:hypothetical protein